MKAIRAIVFVFLLVFLCSCGKTQNNASLPTENVEQKTDENLNTESPQELIEKANEVYGWFEMIPLTVNYDERIEMDGQVRFKIKDDRYNTHEKLDSYLKTFFSDDIVKMLWDKGIYKDFDGYLYSFDGGRGGNIFIQDVAYDVVEVSKDKIIYSATVTYSEDSGESENPQVFEYVREKIDGNWVFTQFPFFW